MGKGVAGVLLASWLDGRPAVICTAAVAAVLGHVAPVFLGFRGGKGGATGAGVLAVLAPIPALGAAAVFLSVVAWKRYVSLGTIVAASIAPLLIFAGQRLGWVAMTTPWPVAAGLGIALLIVARHRENLRRLVAGTERRLGDR